MKSYYKENWYKAQQDFDGVWTVYLYNETEECYDLSSIIPGDEYSVDFDEDDIEEWIINWQYELAGEDRKLRESFEYIVNKICSDRHGVGVCDFLLNNSSNKISLDDQLMTLYKIQLESHSLVCDEHGENFLASLLEKQRGLKCEE